MSSTPSKTGDHARAAALEAGTIVGERYRVVELLGEGGMGAVYRVEHVHMRKLFALKVLHSELLRMPEVVSRFEREAVLAGSINHPNVAAATDFGKLPDGSFFLVLELVVGKSLRTAIAEGPVGAERALAIIRGVVAGVAAAHVKGIVHRDLKPDNIMLVERDGVSDFVKVLDFGIAKGAAMPESRESSAQPLTRIGTIMGTPDYMSPEQAIGEGTDARSDLYSLGVIFFELLTGAAPFHGDPLQVLRQHLTAEPPAIPAEVVATLAVPVAEIVKKLLAKEPKDRFQTASELMRELDGTGVMRAAALPAPAPAPAEETPPGSSRDVAALAAPTAPTAPSRRVIGLGLGALGAVTLAVIVLAMLFSHRDGESARGDTSASAPASVAAGSASASPIESIAAPSSAPAPSATAEEPLASASAEPAPAPPSRRGRGAAGRAAPRTPEPRRTGPGGIYIPPPRDWFR